MVIHPAWKQASCHNIDSIETHNHKKKSCSLIHSTKAESRSRCFCHQDFQHLSQASSFPRSILVRLWIERMKWLAGRPVREGVSTESLKFHAGPPCPTLICPAVGLRPSSSPLDTPSHTGLSLSDHELREWNGWQAESLSNQLLSSWQWVTHTVPLDASIWHLLTLRQACISWGYGKGGMIPNVNRVSLSPSNVFTLHPADNCSPS
jgi:hypothetical protein